MKMATIQLWYLEMGAKVLLFSLKYIIKIGLRGVSSSATKYFRNIRIVQVQLGLRGCSHIMKSFSGTHRQIFATEGRHSLLWP